MFDVILTLDDFANLADADNSQQIRIILPPQSAKGSTTEDGTFYIFNPTSKLWTRQERSDGGEGGSALLHYDVTKQDILDGLVRFIHGGGTDSSVEIEWKTRSDAGTLGDAQTLTIYINPHIITLTAGHFGNVVDKDSRHDDNDIQFIVTQPASTADGKIEVWDKASDTWKTATDFHSKAPGTQITFTLEQLKAGEVRFVHGGGETSRFTLDWWVRDSGTDASFAASDKLAWNSAGRSFNPIAGDDGVSGKKTLTISVSETSDRPTSTDQTTDDIAAREVLEGATLTFSKTNFPMSDADNDTLQLVRIYKSGLLATGEGAFYIDDVKQSFAATRKDRFDEYIEIRASELVDLEFRASGNVAEDVTRNFTYRVFDGTEWSNNAYKMDIAIKAVNDAPTTADKSVNAIEDTLFTSFTTADFAFSDEEETGISHVLITGLPANGKLYVSQDNTLSSTEEITAAKLTSGNAASTTIDGQTGFLINAADVPNLKFIGDANWNGTTSFTFHVVDSGKRGPSQTAEPDSRKTSAEATMTIKVAAVNDLPEATAEAERTVNEGASLSFAKSHFNFSDPADSGDTLQAVRIQIAADQVDSNGNLIAGVGGQFYKGETQLTFTTTGATRYIEVDADDLSLLKFVASDNVADDKTNAFTFIVSDGTHWSDGTDATSGTVAKQVRKGKLDASNNPVTTADPAYAMPITVKAVNDAPTGRDGSVTTREDTDYSFKAADFIFTDEEDASITHIYITRLPDSTLGLLKDGTTTITLSDQSVGGVSFKGYKVAIASLSFDPADNAHGKAFFSFRIADSGKRGKDEEDQKAEQVSAEHRMDVSVTSVQDAPTLATTGFSLGSINAGDTYILLNADKLSDMSNMFSDADNTSIVWIRFTSVPNTSVGTLVDGNGDTLALNQAYRIASSDIGFKAVRNLSSSSSASISFQVADDKDKLAGVWSDTKAFTFTSVRPINTGAPTSADKTVNIYENTQYLLKASDFAFSDLD